MNRLSRIQIGVLAIWAASSAVALWMPPPTKEVSYRLMEARWQIREEPDYLALAIREAAVTFTGVTVFAIVSIVAKTSNPER